jgi:hypothetical protein
MQSTFLKQLAYNQRVLEAEKEVAGIDCDVADFLSGMSLDPQEQLVTCVNGREEMKRQETVIGGQLWMQGDRQMTASNQVLKGMANTREAAILSAVAEAVTWKHALDQEEGQRKGQRVVIYPEDLAQLEAVLSTGNPNVDSEDGKSIAYTQILQAAQSDENPPIFLKEDCEMITKDEAFAEKVPKWMNSAAQVATGNRSRVLENGPDVMNSDEEDAPDEEHGDVLEGMYTPGMDPEKGPVRLTQAQVAAQAPPRSQTPVSGSSDDDDSNGSEYVWSQTKGCMRKNKKYRKAVTDDSKANVSVPISIPEPTHQPTPVNSDTEDQEYMTEDQKRCAKIGKKTSIQPIKGQETPKPMETRRQAARRAGGLRSVGGSGQTDTSVAQGNHSKT